MTFPSLGGLAEFRAFRASRLLALRVDELLDEVASEARVPGSGSGAALVVALAAALVAKVARVSRSQWAEAGGAAAQAETLRARAVLLADADAVVYEEALVALERKEELDPGTRDAAIGDALVRAAEVPLMIATTACDVAVLAADVAEAAVPDAAADAAAAALLADGAARSARHLVEVNLATAGQDPHTGRGAELVTIAASAAKRAVGAAT